MFYGDCAKAAEAGTNEIAQHDAVTCTTKNFTALFPSNNQNLIGILQSLFIKMSDSQTHRFAYRTTPLPPASQIQIQLFCKRCEYTGGHMLYTFRIHLFICWISAPNCWVNNFFFIHFTDNPFALGSKSSLVIARWKLLKLPFSALFTQSFVELRWKSAKR